MIERDAGTIWIDSNLPLTDPNPRQFTGYAITQRVSSYPSDADDRIEFPTADSPHTLIVALLRAPVTGTPIAGLMPRAFVISAARMVTIYDSLYLALAEKRDIPMVTADARLIRQPSAHAGLAKPMIWLADLAV
jgi:hypothetical protein